MKVMLTSCGLETEHLKDLFLMLLDKPPADAKALFIPTAAIDADAIGVLPKCMNDLLSCGIPKEKIRVFDLHKNMPLSELKSYDVVYLCGGNTHYLLGRMNETKFRETLLSYIKDDGIVIGVSAGSLIFANNMPDNLGLLDMKLEVHSEKSNVIGRIPFPLKENLRLSNTAAMVIHCIPGDMEIVDG